MVNVNAYHKDGFNLNFMVLSERGYHVHQTNGGFVYIGLNADCLHKVSKWQHMVPLAYFIASIKTQLWHIRWNYANEFDYRQSWDCHLFHNSIPDESPVGADCDWQQPTLIIRISQSNCHINSYSEALLLSINQTVDNLNNCVCYWLMVRYSSSLDHVNCCVIDIDIVCRTLICRFECMWPMQQCSKSTLCS